MNYAPDVLFAVDSGEVHVLSDDFHARTFDVVPRARVHFLDDLLRPSIRARGPRTLVEMAAQRVRSSDIEAAAARGLAGEGDLVPPHVLSYVRRIVCARARLRRRCDSR